MPAGRPHPRPRRVWQHSQSDTNLLHCQLHTVYCPRSARTSSAVRSVTDLQPLTAGSHPLTLAAGLRVIVRQWRNSAGTYIHRSIGPSCKNPCCRWALRFHIRQWGYIFAFVFVFFLSTREVVDEFWWDFLDVWLATAD